MIEVRTQIAINDLDGPGHEVAKTVVLEMSGEDALALYTILMNAHAAEAAYTTEWKNAISSLCNELLKAGNTCR